MITGSLFTQYFLQVGIRETDAYGKLDSATVESAEAEFKRRWLQLERMRNPSEAETEDEFIFPVLRGLGWEWLVQPSADRQRRDIADALLFLDGNAKDRARPLPPLARFAHGAVIVENEAKKTNLDRAPARGEAPASQVLRYMSRADVHSSGSLCWGLLTNGGTWRLYYGRSASKSEGFVGINLADLLNPPPLAPVSVPDGAPADHWMRVFLLLFHRDAFVEGGPGSVTFLDTVLAEGRIYEARVTENLSVSVFDRVFPRLIQAFADNDPSADRTSASWRAEAREGAIRLLYRLLFLLYAEDRDLLPVRHHGYIGYSLRAIREEAAALLDGQAALSARSTKRWVGLTDLFQAIAEGDATLGLPAYNGGLFQNAPGSILLRVRLPDAVLMPVVDDMSRDGAPGSQRHWINYRDLSVQHLGSIYEQLLEHDVVNDGPTGILLRPSPYARKATGSFYTREELVQLILRRTVAPLVKEQRDAFDQAISAGQVQGDALLALDPAEHILGLRICDPAMGSGHFLVSLVDHLTDAILLAMADASVTPEAIRSPVATRITAIRSRIMENATANGWKVGEAGLDDRHIVRRMVLKRCVFGVDLNPMAVELSKLSLWLHSFTVGAPLSFLDHHLRCGDSLFGEFVGPAVAQLRQEYGLAISTAVVSAQAAAAGMADIEAIPDADVSEVHASRDAFNDVEQRTAPLRAFLDLYHASRWLPPDGDASKIGRQLLFGGAYGDPVGIAQGTAALRPSGPGGYIIRKPTATRSAITAQQAQDAAAAFVAAARAVVAEGRFLHWEAAFPGLWTQWETASPVGGFYAVIGNPPWDRIKMQEVEWWAARQPGVAALARASDRKAAIAGLRRARDALAADYDRAATRAKTAADVAAFLPRQKADGTTSGPYPLYPLFAKGDVNLYALFVERAGQLVRGDGVVGVLVPSGVAADKGAATFFRSISNTGRLGALLDFENGRRERDPFFPQVHRSFKFSVLVHGGTTRRYAEAQCAFFQTDASGAERNAFAMTPEQFARVNPNTGTAPVFRTARDADIVLGIYGRLPVLVDRRSVPPRSLYPVAYATQLHMTSDSGLFRTAEELDADGAYPVVGGAYEKGNTRYLPLMVGRSIDVFDHRFACVLEDESEAVEDEDTDPYEPVRRPTRSRNIHRPYSSGPTTEAQHEDPAFNPRPRVWIDEAELAARWPSGQEWAIGFRDITSATNLRTLIACVVPRVAFGNVLPLLLPASPTRLPSRNLASSLSSVIPLTDHATAMSYKESASLLIANLGVLILDYVARNKVQSLHMSSYILEQLPLLKRDSFTRKFGQSTAENIVRQEVLALSYTAHDLTPFARDQGYAGPPFTWDAEDRLHRRARLDAVFMLLYGLDRATAGYVLDTFPILRRQEEARYAGRFRTRDLVLRYMAAFEAGNPDARMAG